MARIIGRDLIEKSEVRYNAYLLNCFLGIKVVVSNYVWDFVRYGGEWSWATVAAREVLTVWKLKKFRVFKQGDFILDWQPQKSKKFKSNYKLNRKQLIQV